MSERLFSPYLVEYPVSTNLISVHGQENVVKKLAIKCEKGKIDTAMVIGAPGAGKTIVLKELSQMRGGKLAAVFFDSPFSGVQESYGPRSEWEQRNQLDEFWDHVNKRIVREFFKLDKVLKKIEYRGFTKALETPAIGEEQNDRGISAISYLAHRTKKLEQYEVIAVAPEEAIEGKITTQDTANLVRTIVENSTDNDMIANLTKANVIVEAEGILFENPEELGKRIRMVVSMMARKDRVIALNKEIVRSVEKMSNHDLTLIRSHIPLEFQYSPHILHLMHILKVRMRIPEGRYTVAFNRYNPNIMPRINLEFAEKSLALLNQD